MLWYMRNKLRLHVEGIPDFEHVRNANLEAATTYAGYDLTVSKGHCCNNVRRGPWNTKAWKTLLKDAALCLSKNLHPNSAFLLYFSPAIVVDMRIGDNHLYFGVNGRRKFLDELPVCPVVTRDPPTSSKTRWMTLETCWEFNDSYVSVDRLLLCFVCLIYRLLC